MVLKEILQEKLNVILQAKLNIVNQYFSKNVKQLKLNMDVQELNVVNLKKKDQKFQNLNVDL